MGKAGVHDGCGAGPRALGPTRAASRAYARSRAALHAQLIPRGQCQPAARTLADAPRWPPCCSPGDAAWQWQCVGGLACARECATCATRNPQAPPLTLPRRPAVHRQHPAHASLPSPNPPQSLLPSPLPCVRLLALLLPAPFRAPSCHYPVAQARQSPAAGLPTASTMSERDNTPETGALPVRQALRPPLLTMAS